MFRMGDGGDENRSRRSKSGPPIILIPIDATGAVR